MHGFRSGYLVVLLGLMIDLINPALPGVFSLQHNTLYMDGITRAQATVAGASGMPRAARPRTVAGEAVSAALLRTAHRAVGNARRWHEQPPRLRTTQASAARDSADPEDH